MNEQRKIERDEFGRFVKGARANPLGRPRQPFNVRRLAVQHTVEAVDSLVQVIRNPRMSANSQIKACIALLSAAYGGKVRAQGK